MAKVETKQNLLLRPPIVAIMGHVDHGKTTLLDAIRHSRVVEKEHGGITQHIGAYQVEYKGQKITFIDTPGHSAFSQMRARGAKVTDLVILVVAADDGVMPQTKESIAHIKEASVPFIVAINKIDVPGADLNKVKQQLADNNVLVEEYGGDIVTVALSAKTKQGLDDLLEMIILVSQISELKDTSREAMHGVVIESSLDRFRGPLATVLVQAGILKLNDTITTSHVKGKVRSLKDSEGKMLQEASVSTPVEVMGWEAVPGVGDEVTLATLGATKETPQELKGKITFNLEDPDKKEFRLIIKADVAGSLEAIVRSVKAFETQESKIRILIQETGDITESDVYLAQGSRALILGFNVKTLSGAAKIAEREKVPVRIYNIIYELLDELKLGIEALAKKAQVLQIKGKAQVLALFDTSSGQVIGSKVLEGQFNRGDTIKLMQNETEKGQARIVSMRHLKEEITKAQMGQEFGIVTKPNLDFTIGDIILSYT